MMKTKLCPPWLAKGDIGGANDEPAAIVEPERRFLALEAPSSASGGGAAVSAATADMQASIR